MKYKKFGNLNIGTKFKLNNYTWEKVKPKATSCGCGHDYNAIRLHDNRKALIPKYTKVIEI